jgi:serine/threonine-protein kinase HipA
MPLQEYPYEFPALNKATFSGLPGLLSDSLPDKFGNSVINAWLASEGRAPDSMNPVERLCYIGKRGMGALEFEPSLKLYSDKSQKVEIDSLMVLANLVVNQRENMQGELAGIDDKEALENIIRVGTSAGGARAKAILAWNPETNKFRSGQVETDKGFEYWILKFDGIQNNKDKELADPQGFGKIEFAYYLIAKNAGIKMMKSRLHQEGGRSHFMTKRFDKDSSNRKLHVQTFGAIGHLDFNSPGASSYDEAIIMMKQLNLPFEDTEQQVLRAIFNVVGRNQDDHVKNIAFLMNRSGAWRLSPAYDMTYSFNPTGDWTSQHQMSLNNKRDDFLREDLVHLANLAGIKTRKANNMIDQVIAQFSKWSEIASEVGIDNQTRDGIKKALRLTI